MRTALRAARLRAGLSQSELARLVGLTRASYTNIEKRHKNPSLITALLIAHALNKSVDELFADDFPHGQLEKQAQKVASGPAGVEQQGGDAVWG